MVGNRFVSSPRRSCVVCQGPLGSRIDELLATGSSPNRVETQMRAAGTPIKAETVRKHLRICMRDDPIGFVQLRNLAAQIDAGTPDSGTAVQRDVAKIVQRRAIRALQTGQLEVTTRDGLAAQALIDRRADRQKDRAFMLNLARLISGAGRPAPRELIVGDVPRDPDSAA